MGEQSNRFAGNLAWMLLPWVAGIMLYVLALHGGLRLMALDLEALLLNEADALPARVDSASLLAGRLLLEWGAAPVFVIAVAGLIFRIRTRLGGPENPLSSLSRATRATLFTLVMALFVAFCVPFTAALSVSIQVEVFWWLEWHDSIQPTMERIAEELLAWVLPGTITLAAAALWFALGSGEAGPRPGVIRRALRWGGTLVAVGLVLVASVPLLVGLVHASRAMGAPGVAILEDTCGRCHQRVRPLYFVKTPAEWRRTVTRMRELERAPLSEAQQEEVLALLGGMRSFSDEWTFRTRCQRCHGLATSDFEPRSGAEWRAITERLARWSPYYYRPDIRDQVVAQLTGELGADTPMLAEHPGAEQVGRSCGACHSISRNAQRVRAMDPAGVQSLVRRMITKMAAAPDSPEALANTYRELIANPRRFDRLFPHDRPVLDRRPR